jgi:hypothetical protein
VPFRAGEEWYLVERRLATFPQPGRHARDQLSEVIQDPVDRRAVEARPVIGDT